MESHSQARVAGRTRGCECDGRHKSVEGNHSPRGTTAAATNALVGASHRYRAIRERMIRHRAERRRRTAARP